MDTTTRQKGVLFFDALHQPALTTACRTRSIRCETSITRKLQLMYDYPSMTCEMKPMALLPQFHHAKAAMLTRPRMKQITPFFVIELRLGLCTFLLVHL